MMRDAASFHAAIAAASAEHLGDYRHYKVVGRRQPTATTVSIRDGEFVLSEQIDGSNQGGDGTVPSLASLPELPSVRDAEDRDPEDDDAEDPVRIDDADVHGLNEMHGSMQAHQSTFDVIDEILSREEIIWQSVGGDGLSVEFDDFLLSTDDPVLHVVDPPDRRLHVEITDEFGSQAHPPITVAPDGSARMPRLPQGAYRARVGPTTRGGPSAVTAPFLVWDAS